MTPDQADDALRQAIENHARANGFANDDELLSDFAVVAHWQRVEADGRSRYTCAYPRPTVPTHVAVGLFQTAIHLVLFDEPEDDE